MATTDAPAHAIEHPSEHRYQNLATAVEGALWSHAPLRQSNSTVRVVGQAGAVEIHGNVRSQSLRRVAGELARMVPGVTSVDNRLVADPDIECELAMALANDAGTKLTTDRFQLHSILGKVYLGGEAEGPDVDAARAVVARAGDISAAVPGVVAVVNQLRPVVAAMPAAADRPAAPAAAGPATAGLDAARQAVMAERLAIWRERAAARG